MLIVKITILFQYVVLLGSRQHRLRCFSFFTEQNMHVLLTPVGMKDAQLLLLSLQSYLTLCDPIVGSPPGSPIPGILQARTLEWIAISLSNAWKRKVKSLSRVRLLATPWLQPTRLLCPWDSPGKSTGVGCHRLLRISHTSNAQNSSSQASAIREAWNLSV